MLIVKPACKLVEYFSRKEICTKYEVGIGEIDHRKMVSSFMTREQHQETMDLYLRAARINHQGKVDKYNEQPIRFELK